MFKSYQFSTFKQLNNDFDIIIVGGGPSGLSAASFLSDKGYNVALFDSSKVIGEDVVCSGVISNDIFTRYDLPKSSIVAKLQDVELVSPCGSYIEYSHPQKSVSVVDRHKFDYELFNRAMHLTEVVLYLVVHFSERPPAMSFIKRGGTSRDCLTRR